MPRYHRQMEMSVVSGERGAEWALQWEGNRIGDLITEGVEYRQENLTY